MNTHRTDTLKNSFNKFLNRILRTHGQDYYAKLSLSDFIELKKVISTVNNIITLQTTERFIEYLEQQGIITRNECDEMHKSVDATSANANGYDIQYRGRGGRGILAEVKCNIPVGEHCFGAAQINGIRKDITGLLEGKLKSGIHDTSEYLKFMVLLNTGENIETAMNRIIASNDTGEVVPFPADGNIDRLSTKKVYIVYISL